MSLGFRAVAVDFDGTLAEGSRPAGEVLDAVAAARADGRAVVLVTGRIMSELRHGFPDVLDWFDLVVAENGAVVLGPQGERLLADPVDPALEDALVRRGVPVRCGEVLLACDAAHDVEVLEEIRRLGLDHQLVHNRAALMVLPAGVTKGAGLVEALGDLGISRHNTVAVGDAENDHGMLATCEVGVAVGNAVASLKHHADVVLEEHDGRGVRALLQGPLVRGAAAVHPRRWQVELGTFADGTPARIAASTVNVLVCGGSGSGKSYVGGLLAEKVLALGYTALVVDPEGDHRPLGELRGVRTLTGTPDPEQVAATLATRFTSVVADLSSVADDTRAAYLDGLVHQVEDMRLRTGLPHWVLLDEAHRPLCTTEAAGWLSTRGYCLVTYRPEDLSAAVRARLDVVLALPEPGGVQLGVIAECTGADPEVVADLARQATPGQVLLGVPGLAPRLVTLAGRHTHHVRHRHKYADAALPAHLRFELRRAGEPTGRSAGNLSELHRALQDCPSEVLTHHASHHDFSRWALQALQDGVLAAMLVDAEDALVSGADAEQVRGALLGALGTRYLG